jgi:glutathione S-transferase
MILIGQYDSPFVRRVGIALRLYDLPFEHRPWSTFSEADKIRPFNPLTRVPTLVLDNGDVLIESHAMLDYLDSLILSERRMFPAAEPDRHRAIKVASLATGLADKAVSLFYEQRLHAKVSDAWAGRCRSQIGATLQALEAELGSRPGPWWQGERIGHADIAIAAALRFAGEAHPALVELSHAPAVARLCARAEALPPFREIAQAFIPPA